MEKLKTLLLLLFVPVLGLIIPEIKEMGDVSLWAANLVGTAGVVTIIVQYVKNLTEYNKKIHWKYLPQMYGVIIGILLSVFLWFLGVGFFAGYTSVWHSLYIGVLIGGLSNAWFDLAFVEKLLKALTAKGKKTT